MGTRSVRLDDETEKTLARLTKMTGLSISEILKRGVDSLQEQTSQQTSRKPYDVYKRLDLGSEGVALAETSEAKTAIADVIRTKHSK